MIELGTDEITLVLQMPKRNRKMLLTNDWQNIAEDMIAIFEKKSNFVSVYGKRGSEKNAPAGYTVAYKYGEHNFYLAVAYHMDNFSMGIIVKFSAQAWDYYREVAGLEVYGFLYNIVDPDYGVRLSRIDLVADYIDENLNVTAIYQGLMDERIGIFRENANKKTGKTFWKRVKMKYSGLLREQEVPTIYIGSPQSILRLRIYDKKREQIERRGTKLEKAIKCKDWVRFEGVFRSDYAHQITDELLKIHSDNEYMNLIAMILLQKFHFMLIDHGVIDTETEYTRMLLDCITNGNFKLKAPSSKDYDLAKSAVYAIRGSGAMNTLYKIREIWSMDAVERLWEYEKNYFLKKFIPNEDCENWLKKNIYDYQKRYPDFEDFLKDNISKLL